MKIKYIVGLIAAAAFMSGCESLDYTPGDQMSGQTFWKTEDHARQAAIGLYAAMKADWCFGLEFTFDMCSDLADGTAPGPIFPAATHLPPTAQAYRTIGNICTNWCIVPTR